MLSLVKILGIMLGASWGVFFILLWCWCCCCGNSTGRYENDGEAYYADSHPTGWRIEAGKEVRKCLEYSECLAHLLSNAMTADFARFGIRSKRCIICLVGIRV